MTLAVSLKPMDLAALLCSRLCHDLISPVGAIQNAMELYDEGGAEEDAFQLVRWSVASASARLQFARLAFGFAGASGGQIDTRTAEQVAQQYMKEEKAILKWQIPALLLPKNEVKLLLNLLL
ncbi:histidine phosphotransferase family protein, partial [Bartonella sp. CL32QHWL-2]|uniref:histidine phosphotransferase family protein n=1 Tax=Bartonella sp. CL32QHWL-2 TaxID=3243525 RepID=UPI0035D13502